MRNIITITLGIIIVPIISFSSNFTKGKYIPNGEYYEMIYFNNKYYVYHVNLCQGYGYNFGKYKVVNGKLKLYVLDKDYSGFNEPENGEIDISVMSPNSIKFDSVIGCVLPKNHVLYIDKTKYAIALKDNLCLRKAPYKDSDIFMDYAAIENNDKVEIIETVSNKVETVDGKKGKWVLVSTKKDEIGFVFDGYLKYE
jgi:hypothetical protein